MAAVTTPIAASAHEDAPHDDNLITAQFDPSMPTDAPIFGVNAASLSWVLRHGEVTIREDGRTDVRLRGLQIPQADGSQANPLSSITASLYCGGTLAARSSAQAMSVPGGDARFRVWLTVPKVRAMARVLINPAVDSAVYIASATSTQD